MEDQISNQEENFNLSDWEEVEELPRKTSLEGEQNLLAQQQQLQPSSNRNSQLILLEYGKKFQKYKKYKELEQFFSKNYEQCLYFDPEKESFYTGDGLVFQSSSGGQVGTSVLLDSKNKEIKGISNRVLNIEINTNNKELICKVDKFMNDQNNEQKIEFQIDEEKEIERDESSQVVDNHNLNSQLAINNNNNNKQKASSKINSLESIYDWIEKKDRLNRQRQSRKAYLSNIINSNNNNNIINNITNSNNSNNNNVNTLPSNKSENDSSKKKRVPPINQLLKKIKK